MRERNEVSFFRVLPRFAVVDLSSWGTSLVGRCCYLIHPRIQLQFIFIFEGFVGSVVFFNDGDATTR